MLHPAQKIASFFVAKKLIPAQDYEWAVYGLQRRLLAAVFYPILFLIGLLVSDVYSTVLFFVVFTSLRHRVGGHHAGSAMRTSYNDTSKWPINISSGHFMSVSGYNLSNATIQVTDPDVTNQQSSSSYSSGKYYINSSVVYSTCDYFAA